MKTLSITLLLLAVALCANAQPAPLFVSPPVSFLAAVTNQAGVTNVGGLGVAIGITNSGSNITVGANIQLGPSTNQAVGATSLIVSGASTLVGTANALGTINATGLVTANGGLTVNGSSTLTGQTTNTGGLGISGGNFVNNDVTTNVQQEVGLAGYTNNSTAGITGNGVGITNLQGNAMSYGSAVNTATNYPVNLSGQAYTLLVLTNDAFVPWLTNGPGEVRFEFTDLGATNHNLLVPQSWRIWNSNYFSSASGTNWLMVVTNGHSVLLTMWGDTNATPNGTNSRVVVGAQ